MGARPKAIGDQVIVVTGATTPVGAAVARALAQAGARVMLIDSDERRLGEAARAINNDGGRSDYAVALAGHAEGLAAAGRSAVARFGPIDRWIEVDAAALPIAPAALATLLRRDEGAVIAVAAPNAHEAMALRRARLAGEAPGVALAVVTSAADADPARVADAVVAQAARPGRPIDVGALAPQRFVGRHPAVAVALGVGGLALAAGVIARMRRRRDA